MRRTTQCFLNSLILLPTASTVSNFPFSKYTTLHFCKPLRRKTAFIRNVKFLRSIKGVCQTEILAKLVTRVSFVSNDFFTTYKLYRKVAETARYINTAFGETVTSEPFVQ